MTEDTRTPDLFTPDGGDDSSPIEQHASHAYLGYAVSTVKSRALPEIADGLKPVQRRILYAMGDTPGGGVSFSKCARYVGGAGQISPARRQLDLRGAGAPRAAVLDALPADRRAGEFRLARRRLRCRVPVYRSEIVQVRGTAPQRNWGGHGRFPEELRRQVRRVGAAAGPAAVRPAEWKLRNPGRLLDAHSVAQPEGSRRGRGARHQAPALEARGRARPSARSRLPGRWPDHLAEGGDSRGLRN